MEKATTTDGNRTRKEGANNVSDVPSPPTVLSAGSDARLPGGLSLVSMARTADRDTRCVSRAVLDVRSSTAEPKPTRHSSTVKGTSLDSLAALNVFLRAAETCSFTDAGRQLGLSSSAIGKCVARLEHRLGVRLFHRNTRCIKLTQEGKAFLESCRRIFSEIRTVEQEFAQSKDTPKGKLRVSLPLVGMFMIPAMDRFIRDYPEIELDMDFTDCLVDVVDGEYDVVLRSGVVSDSRLMSRRLGTYRFQIVGSPGYFAQAGVPSRPEDLATHSCLHRKQTTTGKIHPWPFSPTAIEGDLDLPTAATASTVDALIHLAERGVGIACVPDFCVRRQIDDGSLINVLNEHVDHTEVIRAMWPSSRYLSPKLRVFIDFLAENLLPKVSPVQKGKNFAAA
jgi:DNA-binding transcriptional LysR family regulator